MVTQQQNTTSKLHYTTEGVTLQVSRPTLSMNVDRKGKCQVWLRGTTLLPDVSIYLSKDNLPDTLVILFSNATIAQVSKADLQRSKANNGYYERLDVPVEYLVPIDKAPEDVIFYL